MKKKKQTKLNDLSQLGSVISFKTVDERAYDAPVLKPWIIDGVEIDRVLSEKYCCLIAKKK